MCDISRSLCMALYLLCVRLLSLGLPQRRVELPLGDLAALELPISDHRLHVRRLVHTATPAATATTPAATATTPAAAAASPATCS